MDWSVYPDLLVLNSSNTTNTTTTAALTTVVATTVTFLSSTTPYLTSTSTFTSTPTTQTQPPPDPSSTPTNMDTDNTQTTTTSYRFPFPVMIIIIVWLLMAAAYFIGRWRQRAKSGYVIPRVFVLCSPRTVQFHYELILRVGLPSWDFNPDKHDIDLSIQGQQKNEVVPVTRLNTKTLLDEPLITNLSLVVYRLVEMPALGGLVLKHSGPFKAWIYAYDFTVIDLSTNKEQYYTLNQYIGSLNRVIPLDIHTSLMNSVNYPIDDVPLPQWTLEDMFLLMFTVLNCIMLSTTLMPINCTWLNDFFAILLTSIGAGCLLIFLNWLLYYHLRWNQDRREYFNDPESCLCHWCPNERVTRIILAVVATIVGLTSIYFAMYINNWRDSFVWILSVINCCTLVIGIWNIARQMDLGESIVGLGLRLRGSEMVAVGMRYSDMVADIRTKSGSNSEDGQSGISMSSGKVGGRLSIGPRSTVKSYGFDPVGGHKVLSSALHRSGLSSTGATPNNLPGSQIVRQLVVNHPRRPHSRGEKQPISSALGTSRSKLPKLSSALTHNKGPQAKSGTGTPHHANKSSRSHSDSGKSNDKDKDRDKDKDKEAD